MSVRKRTWTTPKGETKSGWQADYVDTKGVRRRKMFARKKEADTFLITAAAEVRDGTHVADAETITVAEAASSGSSQARPQALSERQSISAGSTSTFT